MSEKKETSVRQEEFDRLYLKYKSKLLQYVAASIENKNAVEDIVQETFYEAWRKYDTFSKHPNQIGWLYIAAGYKIKEFLRKMGPQDELWMEDEQEEAAEQESGYSKAEMEIMICETLTEDELLRFRRYFVWGETPAEIAEKENITENNVRVRLSRLKQKILTAMHQS